MKVDRVLYRIAKHGIQEITMLEKDWEKLSGAERQVILAEHYEALRTLRAAQERSW